VVVKSNRVSADPGIRSLLAETLLSICAPRHAADVVAEALNDAKLLEVPEQTGTFLRFARISLYHALRTRFGTDVADSTVDGLERVLLANRISGTYAKTAAKTATVAKINVVRPGSR
jgi:hypothetical protein